MDNNSALDMILGVVNPIGSNKELGGRDIVVKMAVDTDEEFDIPDAGQGLITIAVTAATNRGLFSIVNATVTISITSNRRNPRDGFQNKIELIRQALNRKRLAREVTKEGSDTPVTESLNTGYCNELSGTPDGDGNYLPVLLFPIKFTSSG